MSDARDEQKPEHCALCLEPICPGDKAIDRDIPEMGIVRVHIICLAKARIRRIR